MSERTRALMARWTPEQRLQVGLASIDAWFEATLDAELAKGLTPEEAAAAVRARLRKGRA